MLNYAQLNNQQQKEPSSNRSSFSRYAVYYTPRPGTALAAFGRSWFGRANDGATLQAFSSAGLSGADLVDASMASGHYGGLHAQFLAPFALKADAHFECLNTRLINFTGRRQSVETGPLTLARAGRYLVLRPVEPQPSLDWLSAQCTSAIEDLAAAPDESDIAYRHLSPYQRLLLQSFGHSPDYRFSITLTGPLDPAHLERVTQALWPVVEEFCTEGVTVDGLSLFSDSGSNAPMRLIKRYPLSG